MATKASGSLVVRPPESPADFDAVRALCWDYRALLLAILDPIDRQIVDHYYAEDRYSAMMADLQAEHAPPHGAIVLALLDGAPVGCGMFHTVLPGAAEVKRVFVKDSARGLGAGRRVMDELITMARDAGFERILMDTGKPLTAATQLYLSMGFVLRDPYVEMPDITKGRMHFFEMKL